MVFVVGFILLMVIFMIGVLFSGGKDSIMVIHSLLSSGKKVSCLITMKSENKVSWMFHTPAINITKLQAEALEIPILYHDTKGEKEKELKDLEEAILKAKEKFGLTGIAVGALFSQYQYDRVNKICDKLGLECFVPYWKMDQREYLQKITALGFDVRIVGIACQGLSEDYLGKRIDEKIMNQFFELDDKIGLNVAGEGGEYESLVLDGPIFKKRIVILDYEKQMENDITGRLEIKKAELVEKN